MSITGVENFNIILNNNKRYRVYSDGRIEYLEIHNSELTDIYVTLYEDDTLTFSNNSEKEIKKILFVIKETNTGDEFVWIPCSVLCKIMKKYRIKGKCLK